MLEALADVSFPVNPEIHHSTAHGGDNRFTVVEFPAYENRLNEVRTTLRRHGFDPGAALVMSMLDEIKSPAENVAM